jgi:hypothetical protein
VTLGDALSVAAGGPRRRARRVGGLQSCRHSCEASPSSSLRSAPGEADR